MNKDKMIRKLRRQKDWLEKMVGIYSQYSTPDVTQEEMDDLEVLKCYRDIKGDRHEKVATSIGTAYFTKIAFDKREEK